MAALLGLAGSASLGLTMMACYGCPPGTCGKRPDSAGESKAGGDRNSLTDGGTSG